jgi:tRNA(Ile)-lysidine synthase
VRKQVLHYIRERKLLKAGDRVAVAVSGGADSVALLHVLLELREQLGIVLFVAHFNHQLRGEESDADERFVASLARQFDVPFFAGRANVRAHAEANKQSLEHAARELRYRWLTELPQVQQLDAIATAHNSNDQAETVLMKFLRGAGTRGLAGIHPLLKSAGVRIVRPLLETSRAEIEQYLHERKQSWREDHTNRDRQHLRNRIRHELLPLLAHEYNPNLQRVLGETAQIARDEEEFWRANVLRELNARAHPRAFLLRGFHDVQVASQRRLLKVFLESRQIAADFRHIEDLRRCALGETGTVSLSCDWLARREGNWLRLVPTPLEVNAGNGYQCELPVERLCYIRAAGISLRLTIVLSEAAAAEPSGSLLNLAQAGTTFALRNWLPGDRYRPAYCGSEKKVKELFADKKIPIEQRSTWPVVLCGDQIVWVRGFPVAHDFAWVSGSGDAVRIEVLPYEPPQASPSPEATSK